MQTEAQGSSCESMNASACQTSNGAEIKRSFSTLQSLIGISDEFLNKQQYVLATVSAQIAALYASYNHPGEFASPKLERILRIIGNKTVDDSEISRLCARENDAVKRVLHVLTAAKDVGGDSRFVWRWIQRDSERCHSVALTYQLYFDIPKELSEAVANRGGCVHILDRDGVNAIQRAHTLRRIARDADVVFLHIYIEDVVPTIAFANKAGLPPIVFVVQADHQFWTGVSVCDLFVHLRESGLWLSEKRRGIDQARMALLPIPLDLKTRKASRSEAKRKIGLSEEMIVLLSIARAIKYMPVSGYSSFVEVMISIINKHKNAILLVVGPGDADEWKTGYEKTGGRIQTLGQRSDTQVFYEAADIYLDSFPFSSNTSLLEAGSYALPLVSYFPYSKESAVMGPGAPGLDSTLVVVKNLEDYESTISRLIGDADLREEIGEQTKNGISFMHIREGWSQALEGVYRATCLKTCTDATSEGSDESCSGELDLLLNRYYSRHFPLGWIIGWYARHLPYGLRLRLLTKMLKINRSFVFSMFLPKWVQRWVGGRFRHWRDLPGIARWLSAKG